MIEVSSYLNELEIVHSGNAHIIYGSILKINFSTVKLQIQFTNDEKSTVGNIVYTVENEILKVNFINYNSSSGSGIFHPWKIGIVEGKEFYMTIDIRYLFINSNYTYVCNYVFYTGKEVSYAE